MQKGLDRSAITCINSILKTAAALLLASSASILGGGAALALLPKDASAAIIQSPAVNLTVPATIFGIYINVVSGAASSSPSMVPGWDLSPYVLAGNNFRIEASVGSGLVTPGSPLVSNLALGTMVDSSQSFYTSSLGTPASSGPNAWDFSANGINYIGFRFLNESTNQTNYAWASILDAAAQNRIFQYIYYEDTGLGIAVGDTGASSGIPEPSTIALLGAGAVGLAAWRRRQSN